jgi:hypothetical protein
MGFLQMSSFGNKKGTMNTFMQVQSEKKEELYELIKLL